MGVSDYVLNSSGGQITPRGHAPEVLKLAAQLNSQRYKAGLGPGKPSGPGVLGKIFDVIQRPLYASANTVDYAIKGKNPLEGTWRGVSGQDKTSYDKVLEDMGMSGGWQRSVLGFGADIALDPTTYLGLGIEKNLAEGVARKAGVEASEAAIKKEMAPKLLQQMTERTVEASKIPGEVETVGSKVARASHFGQVEEETARAMKGIPHDPEVLYRGAPAKQTVLEPTLTKKEARLAIEETQRGKAMDAIHEAKDAALAKERGKVYLKFMGKQTPIASEGLYNVGSKIGEATRDLPVLKGINSAFRTTYNNPQGLNAIIRNAETHGIHLTEEQMRELGRMVGKDVVTFKSGEKWGGLGEGEMANILRAKSAGRAIEGVAEKSQRPLQHYLDYLTTVDKHLAGEEMDLGLLAEKHVKENYVPMLLNGGTKDAQKAFKKGYRAGLPGHTFEDAERLGLKPNADIIEAYSNKIIKSNRKVVPARINDAAEREFGIHMDALAPGKVSKRTGKQIAQDLDLKPYSLPGFKDKTAWFPPEVGDALQKTHKTMTDPAAGGELLKYFDKVQNSWKLGMTAVNPGHHIRNFAGDVYLNFMDGVKNPARYSDATRVLRNWRDNPTSFKMLLGGKEYDAAQLHDLFVRNGGKSGFFRQEYAQTAKSIQSHVMHPVEAIRKGAELREDWTRMAHFLDIMEKGGVKGSHKDIEALAREAGKKIRKFNIDYGDLTPFEKNFMKRVVPFYTWMRKNIPLQLETLAMDPGKINVIPKGLRALQNITGAEPDTSQYMGLNLVPQWLREMAGVRISGEGVGRNQIYWNPNVIPFMDLGTYFNEAPSPVGVGRQFASNLSPLIRAPIEQSTGRMLNSGAPVGDTLTYGGQQVLPPSVPALSAILRGKGEAPDWGKLTGASLYNVGPQQNLSELRRQQDTVQALLKAQKKRRARSWEPGYGEAG